MLIIKKDFNFDEFEKALKEVRSNPSIRLPSKINHIGFWGIEVALIQLLITWQRSHDQPSIKTYINNSDSEETKSDQLNDFGRRIYGISALYLTGKLTTAQGVEIPRDEYVLYCSTVLKQMHECDIHSFRSVNRTYPQNRDQIAAQFICLHRTKYEFLKALYDRPARSTLISRSRFGALIESVFRKKKGFADYLHKQSKLSIQLSNLVYELFQNTNDHACEGLDGIPFNKNIRTFSLKSHSLNEGHHKLSEMESENEEQFNSYLNHCREKFESKDIKMQKFLEISVVDGGLGFAQRFTGKPIKELSIEEERRITEKCFRDGVSSKDSSSRGKGLDEVWKSLCELDGFIRIRTGRLCLFQTFHDKNYSPHDKNYSPHDKNYSPPRTFSDWSSDKLDYAFGTAVTVIIPCAFYYEPTQQDLCL